MNQAGGVELYINQRPLLFFFPSIDNLSRFFPASQLNLQHSFKHTHSFFIKNVLIPIHPRRRSCVRNHRLGCSYTRSRLWPCSTYSWPTRSIQLTRWRRPARRQLTRPWRRQHTCQARRQRPKLL